MLLFIYSATSLETGMMRSTRIVVLWCPISTFAPSFLNVFKNGTQTHSLTAHIVCTYLSLRQLSRAHLPPTSTQGFLLPLVQTRTSRLQFYRLETVIKLTRPDSLAPFCTNKKFVKMLMDMIKNFLHQDVYFWTYVNTMTTPSGRVNLECGLRCIFIETSKQCFDAALERLSKCPLARNSASKCQNESTLGTSVNLECTCGVLSLQYTSPLSLHWWLMKISIGFHFLQKGKLQVELRAGSILKARKELRPMGKWARAHPTHDSLNQKLSWKTKNLWTITSLCPWLWRARISAIFCVTLHFHMELWTVHR